MYHGYFETPDWRGERWLANHYAEPFTTTRQERIETADNRIWYSIVQDMELEDIDGFALEMDEYRRGL